MISKDEITKLASLARIGVGEEEAESLAGEIDAILGYVGQVSHVVAHATMRDGFDNNQIQNVMREDTNPNESGKYTDVILKEMPQTENGYLKVKKIL